MTRINARRYNVLLAVANTVWPVMSAGGVDEAGKEGKPVDNGDSEMRSQVATQVRGGRLDAHERDICHVGCDFAVHRILFSMHPMRTVNP